MLNIRSARFYAIIALLFALTTGLLLIDKSTPFLPILGENERKQEITQLIKNYGLYAFPQNDKFIQGELKGIVSSLDDKYSEYQSIDEQKKFQDAVNQKYEGIGVKFENKNNALIITKLIENSPAQKSGLQVGDVLKQVNQDAVDNFSNLSEVVDKIRGEKGTVVQIIIERDGINRTFNITRNSVTNDLVSLELKNQIAVVTVSSFGQGLASKMVDIVRKINGSNVKATILDLRGDTGGLLDQATGVMSCFIDPNIVVVKEKDRNGISEIKTSDQGVKLANMPIYMLTDSSTASASEILVGAFQDVLHAKSVGQKTYGKGVVQKLFTLRNGDTLKLTVSEWLTPNNREINKKGIDPDIQVKIKDDSLDVAINEALKTN